MSLSNSEKRRLVIERYDSPSWTLRVQGMTDQQVHVIFIRMVEKGEIRI